MIYFAAEEKAKGVEVNDKKRARQSDSEGSETDKQKPKRVYPLRSRSTSGDPRESKSKVRSTFLISNLELSNNNNNYLKLTSAYVMVCKGSLKIVNKNWTILSNAYVSTWYR